MNTRSSSWNTAQIHAYVDGVLEPEAAARLESDSRHDSALAAHIEQQRALRVELRAALDPVLDEPIPERLLGVLAAPDPRAAVTPIGAARTQGERATRPTWSMREWGALAATLVIGALLGPFVFRGPDSLPLEMQQGRLVAAGYLDAALSAQVAGPVPQEALVRIDVSFRASNGEYCRTFALQAGGDGLACRRDGRWSIDLLDGAAATSADGFRQASSGLSPAMLGAITALGAGEPLTMEQERERMESGWEAPSRD